MREICTIANDLIQVSVKETGAELCSIKSVKSQKEYVWQANPEIWPSHAPNLFPVIGCLKDNGFLYKGKEFKCPKHGFIRNNEKVTLLERGADFLVFGLKYDDESLEIYPFKFEFRIKYTIEANHVIVEHTVVNHGDNEMLFSLGGHPGFNCPMNEGEAYNDYYLEFEAPETAQSWRVVDEGLIGKDTIPVFNEPQIINLHSHLFDEDALIFKNLNSSRVSLKSRKSKQVLSMSFKDFPYLGVWAKPNAPYVCIEPWIGIADSVDTNRNFETKEGLVTLTANQSKSAIYMVSIEE